MNRLSSVVLSGVPQSLDVSDGAGDVQVSPQAELGVKVSCRLQVAEQRTAEQRLLRFKS
jgi:hypothetical protein